MNNVLIADNQVERMRSICTAAAKDNEFQISKEDLIDILTCLERLASIERHLYNLVSPAYEEEDNA